MKTIQGSFFTYDKFEDSKIMVTAFSEKLNQQIKICVKTTDFGVAAVDAFLYFERLYKGKVELQQLEYLCGEYSGSVNVSILSNELLNNYLTSDNKELVACFISLCDIDSCEQNQDLATAENILLQDEVFWNTVRREPVFDYSYNKENGALLTIEIIQKRYSHIWNNYLFTEKTNMFYEELIENNKIWYDRVIID